MKTLRNWLWQKRYRKWRASVGMNLSPKKLVFATSGITDSMRGIRALSPEEVESRQRLQQMLLGQMQSNNPYRRQCESSGQLLGSLGGLFGLRALGGWPRN